MEQPTAAPTAMPTRPKPKLSPPIRTFVQPPYSQEEVAEIAEVLAVSPPGTVAVVFVRPQSVLLLPEIAFNIDDALSLLSKRTDGILSEQMLSEANIEKAVFMFTEAYYGGAVLSGDFSGALELLQEEPETSDGVKEFDPPTALEPHRGKEVFLFPYYDDLYISVPDESTMLLAQSEQLHKEIVDRYLDESVLDESLARLLETTGQMDFLLVRHLEAERDGQEGGDPESPIIYAGGGWLDAEESSSVFNYAEFVGPEAASQFMAEWEEWPLVQGYNSGKNYPIQEIRQQGQSVIALGVTPNIDLEGWLLGN